MIHVVHKFMDTTSHNGQRGAVLNMHWSRTRHGDNGRKTIEIGRKGCHCSQNDNCSFLQYIIENGVIIVVNSQPDITMFSSRKYI